MSETTANDPPKPAKVPAWATCADVLAVGLIAIAGVVLATGGIRTAVFDVRLSMTAAWRPAVLALLLVIGRHLGLRRPNLPVRIVAFLGRVVAWLAGIRARGPWARWRSVLLVAEAGALADDARRALRVPAREVVLVAGLMIVLTGLMLRPQMAHLDAAPDLGDPLFSMWRIAWTAHQLPRDPLRLFDGNMLHPERLTLAYSDSMLLPAVLVGAVVFAFYPFRFQHYPHFELLFSFWVPLVLLAVHRALVSGRIRNGLAAGAALAGQVLSSIYFGIFLAAYLVPLCAVLAIGWRRVRGVARPSWVLLHPAPPVRSRVPRPSCAREDVDARGTLAFRAGRLRHRPVEPLGPPRNHLGARGRRGGRCAR